MRRSYSRHSRSLKLPGCGEGDDTGIRKQDSSQEPAFLHAELEHMPTRNQDPACITGAWLGGPWWPRALETSRLNFCVFGARVSFWSRHLCPAQTSTFAMTGGGGSWSGLAFAGLISEGQWINEELGGGLQSWTHCPQKSPGAGKGSRPQAAPHKTTLGSAGPGSTPRRLGASTAAQVRRSGGEKK